MGFLATHNPMTLMRYECGHSGYVDSRARNDGERARFEDHQFLESRGVEVGPWICPACRGE